MVRRHPSGLAPSFAGLFPGIQVSGVQSMKIRRKVFNMTWEMWKLLDKIYGTEKTIETTPQEFYDKIGLPSCLSAYCTEEENMFFNEIYKIHRGYYEQKQKPN